MNTKIRQPFVVIIALICLVVVLAKLADWGALGVDSSVFAAVGQHINHYGSVIYRDIWDHKFPGIFFINAAIFRLLPEVPYSIQLFEMAYGCLTSIAFYGLLRQFIDRPSLQICGAFAFAFFSNLHLLTEGGNLTENYMLLPLLGEFTDKIIQEHPSIVLISPQTPLDRIELQSLWVFISQKYTQSTTIQGWIIYRRNN